MNKTEAMKRLKAAGSAQTRKIYTNHGVEGEMFGVSYADLGKLVREIKVDQELAEALWATKNHDAQVLATMIADPNAMTAAKLEAWSKSLSDHVITSTFADLASRLAGREKLMKKWTRSQDEWISTVGWFVLARMSDDESLADDDFAPWLKTIEAKIHSAKNRTRYGMNTALIAIGCRPSLTKDAIAAAMRIGPVEVDHGNTTCRTPDAASYIRKTVAYRKARAARATTKKTATTRKKAPSRTARRTPSKR
jgi:3-methyladenine DNA glycosylase AlkD